MRQQGADKVFSTKSNVTAPASVDAECCTSPEGVYCSLIDMGLGQSKFVHYLVAQQAQEVLQHMLLLLSVCIVSYALWPSVLEQ